MNKQRNQAVLQENEILRYIMSDLVPVIADDLRVGFRDADDIIRSTELYMVLSSECILQDDYSLDSLLLILRKELIRDGKYPVKPSQNIDDSYDFVRTMKHEMIGNCIKYKNINISLTQVSLIVEGIENFAADKDNKKLIRNISILFDRCVRYLPTEKICSDDEQFFNIWWRLYSYIQILLLHCKIYDKNPSDLTDEEIDDYLSEEM